MNNHDIEERLKDLEAKMNVNNQEHKDIVMLLIKIRFAIYGSIGVIMVHEVGALEILKKAIGL